MNLIENQFGGIKIFKSSFSKDNRGGFLKIFDTTHPLLKKFKIKQINFVQSLNKYIIRGFHYQKGKFAEATFAEVSALKIVDFPTLGSPIMPQVKPIRRVHYPKDGLV